MLCDCGTFCVSDPQSLTQADGVCLLGPWFLHNLPGCLWEISLEIPQGEDFILLLEHAGFSKDKVWTNTLIKKKKCQQYP